jgi:hypothetical protein
MRGAFCCRMKCYFEVSSGQTSKRGGGGGPFIPPHTEFTVGVSKTQTSPPEGRTSPDRIFLNLDGNG